MFDANINVIGISANVPSEEALAQGELAQIEIVQTLGLLLPFSEPGSNSPLAVPAGQLRYKIDKKSGANFAQSLAEASEKLPEKPVIETASPSDLAAAAQVQGKLDQLRGT